MGLAENLTWAEEGALLVELTGIHELIGLCIHGPNSIELQFVERPVLTARREDQPRAGHSICRTGF